MEAPQAAGTALSAGMQLPHPIPTNQSWCLGMEGGREDLGEHGGSGKGLWEGRGKHWA